jgi:hypothetical protein
LKNKLIASNINKKVRLRLKEMLNIQIESGSRKRDFRNLYSTYTPVIFMSIYEINSSSKYI